MRKRGFMKNRIYNLLLKTRSQLTDGWVKISTTYIQFKNSPSGKKFLELMWELLKVAGKAVLAYLIKKLLVHFFG